MKRSLFLLLCALFLEMCGCGLDMNREGYEKVIGACLSQTNITPFGVQLQSSLEKHCAENNWKFVCLDAERDAAKQATQAAAMLQMEVDLFLFWPTDRNAGITVCEQFHEMDIPVVVINADVAEEGIDYTTAFVGPNQYQMAKDIAEYLTETTPDEANVVIIDGGVESTQFMQRTQGFLDGISGSTLTVLRQEYSESDRSRAQTIMENYLTLFDKIDIVYCASDNLAIGAINAIRSENRPGIRIVSIDGMREAFECIRNGEMELTVLQSPEAQAERFVAVAKEIFDGKTIEDRYCYSEYTLITSENVEEYQPAY